MQRPPRLWRHGDFMRLWSGETASMLGDHVTSLALPTVAITQLHAVAFDIGLLVSLAALPYPLLALPAGVRVSYASCCDIRQTVLHCLAHRRLRPDVVHSTSWRQEGEAVVLTHLAVVRPPAPSAIPGIRECPTVRRPLARGTSVCPPARPALCDAM